MTSITMMSETDATIIGSSKADFTSRSFYQSCTVVIGATVLLLGGSFEKNQISQLTPLGLTRIGTLAFPFDAGTCLVMGSQLFLGFGSQNENICWSR